MHFTVHHPTEPWAADVVSCRIEGHDPGNRYTIRFLHGVSKKLGLFNEGDQQVALMKLEFGLLPNNWGILDGRDQRIGQVKGKKFAGRSREAFQLDANPSQRQFSIMAGGRGVWIRPEQALQLDTKTLDLEITHDDTVLMLCFSILWLQRQMGASRYVRGAYQKVGRRNIPWR